MINRSKKNKHRTGDQHNPGSWNKSDDDSGRGHDRSGAADQQLEELIRLHSPRPSDEQRIQRIKNTVLQERLRVLGRRRRFRHRIRITASAAAALLLLLVVYRLIAGFTPERGPGKPFERDAPDTASTTTKQKDGASFEAVIDRTISELSTKTGRVSRRKLKVAASSLAARSPKALSYLEEIGRKQDDRFEAAVMLLASIGTPASEKALIHILEDAPSPDAIDTTVTLLHSMEAEHLLSRMSALPAAGPRIIATLGKRAPSFAARLFRNNFGRKIQDGATQPFLTELVNLLTCDHTAFTRALIRIPVGEPVALAQALGRTGTPKAWLILKVLSTHRTISAAFLRACGEIAAPEAVPLLKKYIEYGDQRGAAAIEALGRIHTGKAAQVLLDAKIGLCGPAPFTERSRAVDRSLKQQGDAAVALLARSLRNGPRQRVALQVLLDVFPDDAAGVLCECLDDTPPDITKTIIGALGRLGDPAAVRVLIPLLYRPEFALPAHRSLVKIVGRDLGCRPGQWQAWWRRHINKKQQNALFQSTNSKGDLS